MSCLLTRLWLFPAVLVLAGAVPMIAHGETGRSTPENRPDKVRKGEKEREIERKLNNMVTFNFADTPLKHVIEDLRTWNGINIWVDTVALQQEGIDLNQLVTFKLEQVRLRSALTLLLRPMQLTFVIKNEVLEITTENEARGKLVTATYLVADLIAPSPSWSQLATLAFPYGLPVAERSPAPPAQTPEQALIDAIRQTIAPKSWSGMSGPGTIDYFPLTMSLVINQTLDRQEQIQDLLQSLRRLQDDVVSLEVTVVSVGKEMAGKLKDQYGIDCSRSSKLQGANGPQVTQLGEEEAASLLDLIGSDRKTQVELSPTLVLLSGQTGCVQLPDAGATCYAIDIQNKKGRFYTEESRPGVSLDTQTQITLDRKSVRVNLDLKTILLQRPWDNWKVKQTLTIPVNGTAILSGWKIAGNQKPASWVSESSSDACPDEETTQTRFQLVLVTPKLAVEDDELEIYHTGGATQPVPGAVKTGEEFLKEANQEAAAVLVKKYRQACSEGRDEEARKLARQALHLDPACFSKTP